MLDPARDSFPWLLSPVMLVQGLWARSRTPRLPEAAGPQEGRCGSAGPPLQMCALGDSIMAGVGVAHTGQALPAQLARALAQRLGRTVCWHSQGRNGARTRDLLAWGLSGDCRDAGLLVISNGLNDVTSLMSIGPWLEEKRRLYHRLHEMAPGAIIAQLGLPPLGHFPALPNPLRWLFGRRAAAFDQALQTLAGSLPQLVYLPFRSVPDPSLFAEDGYHPGPEAVAIWAGSLADMLAARLEAGRKGEAVEEDGRGWTGGIASRYRNGGK